MSEEKVRSNELRLLAEARQVIPLPTEYNGDDYINFSFKNS
jgi:hypothetical protein